jgi:hypothetical protein
MFAKYDSRSLILEACGDLPCAPSTFLPALLALDPDAPSVSDTGLSKALRGNGDLAPEKYKALLDKLAECRELKKSAGGIPVAFTNAEVIHGLLMERRRLSREVKVSPQMFSVTIGDRWFVERNKFGELIATNFSLLGSRMTRGTAERVRAELNKLVANQAIEVVASPGAGSAVSFERLFGLPALPSDPTAIETAFEAQ